MFENFSSTWPAGGNQGRRRAWRQAAIRLLAAALIAGGFIATASTPAMAQGTWAQATEITAPTNVLGNPIASVSGISCSSAGNCTGVGGYTDSSENNQAMVATETSGTWAEATEVTAPANAGQPRWLPVRDLVFLGRELHRRRELLRQLRERASHGGHRDLRNLGPSHRGHRPGQCREQRRGLPRWDLVFLRGELHRRGSYFDSSANNQAMVATETSGTWAQATELTAPANAGSNPVAGLNGISCSSAGNCTAAGFYADSSANNQAMVAIETSGTWAQATEVTAPANARSDPGAYLDGIWCSSAGNCTAAGTYADSSGNSQAMTATETSGTWAQATEVTAPADAGSNPGAALNGISCSSAGNCTAAGGYTDSSGNSQATTTTETSGTWAQATEVPPRPMPGATPWLPSAGFGVPRAGTAPPPGTTSTAPDTTKP